MITKKTQLFFTALLCILFSSSSLFSQNRFVSTTGTDVGPNDCSNVGSPCLTIQNALNEASSGDVIQVDAGTYRENLSIVQPVTLQGANQGTNGFDTRVGETIIQPAVTDLIDGIVVLVNASDVTIDGFTITGNNDLLTGPSSTIFDALQGVTLNATSINYSNISLINNIFRDFPRDNRSVIVSGMEQVDFIDGTAATGFLSAAVSLQGSNSFESTGHQIRGNAFRDIDDQADADYSDFLGYGIVFANQVYPEIAQNKFTDVGGGIFALNIPKTAGMDSVSIDTCFFNRNKVGVLVANGPTNLTGDSLTIQNSIGFGIRIVRVGNDDNIDFYLNNSQITETGNALTNYSGLASESFTGSGITTVRLDSCIISNNMNRGLTFRGNDMAGTNVGEVNHSILEGNAYNRAAGGNGYGIIANASAQVSVFQSTLSNQSSSRTATEFDALLGANTGGSSTTNGGLMTIRSCAMSISAGITSGVMAQEGSGLGTPAQIDASFNWWNTTSETSLNGNVTGNVDFSPWLNSGTDQDMAAFGFQPDVTAMNIGLSGVQTGGSRIQEAIDGFTETNAILVNSGTYSETVLVSKNLSYTANGSVSVDQLTMDGTGIILTVDNDIIVNNGITLTDGNIAISDGNSIILTATASNIVESSVSRIEGRLSAAPRNVTSGVGLNLLGVNFIGGTNDLENLVVTRISGSQGENLDGEGDASIGVTWDLTASVVPIDWAVNFSWPSEFDNGNLLSGLTIWRDGGSGYEPAFTGISASGDPRITDNVVINSFSDYTIGDVDVALPVTLSDFKANQITPGVVQLNWITLSEENSEFFQIEKSFSGEDFFSIGRVQAAGDSFEKLSYHFEDEEFKALEVFYRLKIVDLDGSYEYSNSVYESLSNTILAIFPNPASSYLDVPLAENVDVILSIYDQSGRIMLTDKSDIVRKDISTLQNGMYFYRLQIGNSISSGKLIKE